MLKLATVLFATTTLIVASLVVVAVRAASLRLGRPVARANRAAGITALALAALLAVEAAAASSGVLSNFDARPPRLFFVLGGSLGAFGLATSTRWFGALLVAAPRVWPIALQSMRVPIELGLFALFAAGRLPVHLTFEGRNFDVVVGLTAPVVALAVSRGWLGPRALVAWHAVSLCLLFHIVGMAVTTFPGPLHLAWPGVSNEIIATAPFVWLPGFLVPVALFGHVLSLRQLASTWVQPAPRSATMPR